MINVTREQYEELKTRTNTPMSQKYKYRTLKAIKEYNELPNDSELKTLTLENALQTIWDYNDVSRYEHEELYEDFAELTYRVSHGRLHYDIEWVRR